MVISCRIRCRCEVRLLLFDVLFCFCFFFRGKKFLFVLMIFYPSSCLPCARLSLQRISIRFTADRPAEGEEIDALGVIVLNPACKVHSTSLIFPDERDQFHFSVEASGRTYEFYAETGAYSCERSDVLSQDCSMGTALSRIPHHSHKPPFGARVCRVCSLAMDDIADICPGDCAWATAVHHTNQGGGRSGREQWPPHSALHAARWLARLLLERKARKGAQRKGVVAMVVMAERGCCFWLVGFVVLFFFVFVFFLCAWAEYGTRKPPLPSPLVVFRDKLPTNAITRPNLV